MTGRRAVRAILIDDEQRLVLLRRVRPGQPPYWVTPGGGIEPTDANPESALHRELLEELGATIEIRRQVFLTASGSDASATAEVFLLGRLTSMDASRRTGHEYRDATRGTYDVDRIDPLGDELRTLALRPELLRCFILENAVALLAEVAAGR